MKVRVTLQVPSKSVAMKTVDLVIFATDSVSQVKERLSSAVTLPFQEQALLFQGKVLPDDHKLSDCGVQEGSSLDFVTKGCEGAFVSQLAELLQGKKLATEELCLLYAHKHGISTGQVLEALGFDGTMKEYLQAHKRFAVSNGCASVAREDITLNVCVQDAMPGTWMNECSEAAPTTRLEVVVATGDTISAVKAKASALIDVPKAFPNLHLSLDGKPLDDDRIVSACGLQDSSHLEFSMRASETSLASQLAELLTAHAVQDAIAVDKLGHLYTCHFGATAEEAISSFSAVLRKRGLRDFLAQQSKLFTLQGTRVSLFADSGRDPSPEKSQHEKCLDLHGRISSVEFRTQVAQALTRINSVILGLSSLRIHHVVTGGSVGKGTAIEGDASAEVTVFVEDLPLDQTQCIAGLLESMTKELRHLVIEDMPAIQVANVGNHGLRLTCDGFPDVDLLISPVFETHSKALDVLAAQSAELQHSFTTWLAEQQVRFVKKQPEPVKVTARLLKWWRNQRQWSSTASRPSDLLLELLAIHVACQLPAGKSYDQGAAIALAAAAMTRFDSLHITWQSAFYGRYKVSGDILAQRPLLMDPCNPFVNVASPATFDPGELMAYAEESPQLLF